MNRVVAVGRQPGTTRVSEVMTARPRTVASQETVENCLFLMREFGFRHLPICDGKELKGLVSSRDILLDNWPNGNRKRVNTAPRVIGVHWSVRGRRGLNSVPSV